MFIVCEYRNNVFISRYSRWFSAESQLAELTWREDAAMSQSVHWSSGVPDLRMPSLVLLVDPGGYIPPGLTVTVVSAR
jgi:hypothetical protein